MEVFSMLSNSCLLYNQRLINIEIKIWSLEKSQKGYT